MKKTWLLTLTRRWDVRRSSSSSLPPLVMPMDRMPSSMRAMYSSLALCDVAAECFGLSSRRERGVSGGESR